LPNGELRSVRQRRTKLNEDFFRDWSPEMAYVLGVIYSDGCLSVTHKGYHTVTIAQKQPELLEKCLALMDCDAPVTYRAKKVGGIYTIAFNGQDVGRHLVALGLHPRKSLTIQFPNPPTESLRHFIRGCWDGDGSICRCGKSRSSWTASYVSGSPGFTWGMRNALVSLGMPDAKVHLRQNPRLFTVCWYGRRCAQLYHILYGGVPPTQYLLRKYRRFQAAAAEWNCRITPP
jgi:hypothetical protein